MNRRRVLHRLSVAGIASLTAGCLGDRTPATESTTPPQTTPESTTSTRTTLDPSRFYNVVDVKELPAKPPQTDVACGDDTLDDVERPYEHSPPQEVSGLELTASKDNVAIGEDITFSLRNVTEEPIEVGTIYKYNVQRLENDRWTPLFQTPTKAWHDIAYILGPGAGYDWSFTVDREGLEREHKPHEVSYHVCSPLEPGTYRFAFWGVIDDALATRFTVESP